MAGLGHQRRFGRKPRPSASPPIPDISLRRTDRRPNRLTRDEARAARSCCGGTAPCLCADHSWCHPPGYRWRKPAFPTMSGGRNGTPYHDRQTDLSPQRAPGALDLIPAVQQGDKIIMTFEETMAKPCEVWRPCRPPPRRVQRAVAERGYARVLSCGVCSQSSRR
jgi:hypothetical protein